MNVTLPLCQSANRYWRAIVQNGRVRVLLSKAGRDYKNDAHWAMVAQGINRQEQIEGPCIVSATVYFPNKRGDLDNRIKPTLDVIQGFCITNDKNVVKIAFARETDKDNPRVELCVTPAMEGTP